jgi:hypothetical protein
LGVPPARFLFDEKNAKKKAQSDPLCAFGVLGVLGG